MGIRTRWWLAAVLAGFVPGTVLADDALWQRLRTEPNLVVLMRHGHAGGGDPVHWDRSGACAGESRLTPAGRTLAQRIGEAFGRHGLKPVVVSSPMCRCRETAELAFGDAGQTDPALVEMATADTARIEQFRAAATGLLARHRGRAPVVFVSHRPNIDQLIFDLIEIGELVVGRIATDGEIEVLGKMRVVP